LRRPVFKTVSANARRKKEGVAVIAPNDAKAMLPDLRKYLLFMILNLIPIV
jgi:hypothetical protein